MILKNIKVYHLFWIIASIIVIIGLSNHNDTLDINVHDTYFVVAYLHVTIALFLFYFLNGLGYWLIQKQLKKKLLKPLTIIHSTILIGSFIIYWLIIFLDDKLFVIDPNFPLLNYKNEIINMTLVSEFLLIVFLAFPIFIINLFVSLLRRTNNIKT
jgi:heme/copper-type cytochrome/quinol oxidase subunit 1